MAARERAAIAKMERDAARLKAMLLEQEENAVKARAKAERDREAGIAPVRTISHKEQVHVHS